MLQCGRVLMNAESEFARVGEDRVFDASMWPRSHERGKSSPGRIGQLGRQASMWPRSHERGKEEVFDTFSSGFSASMWPRSHERGKGTFPPPAWECPNCFNVAAFS